MSSIPLKTLIIAVTIAWISPAFAQIDWTWRSPQTTGNTLNSAAWNGNVLVVVGENGQIATSTDDTTWTIRKSGTAESLTGIVYGTDAFYAVGHAGVILTSKDGASWTRLESAASRNLNGVVWMKDRAVAVGDSGTAISILTSGQVTAGSAGVNMNLTSIAWNGKLLMAVGQDSVVVTSADGISWNSKRGPSVTKALTSVVCTDSVFYTNGMVIVRNGEIGYPQGVCFGSKDGTAWSSVAAVNGTAIQSFTVNKGKVLCSFAGDIAQPLSNTDVKTFYTSPIPTSFNAIISKGTQMVAVGFHGTILISTSDTTWRRVGVVSDINLQAVAWTGKRLVAVGDSGIILTSSDGIAWKKEESTTRCSLTDVLWTGTRLMAVGSTCILTSSDGSIWKSVFPDSIAADFKTIFWDGSHYFAGGMYSFVSGSPESTVQQNGAIFSSPDGTTWTLHSLSSTAPIADIAWNGTVYAGVDRAGLVFTSSDGATWKSTGNYVNSNSIHPATVLWNGTGFYAFGNNIGSLTSADGTEWVRNPIALSEGTHYHSVAWSGREFVAVGAGNILTSPDGSTWTVRFNPGSRNLNSVICTGTQFVAVGDYGNILTSPVDTSYNFTGIKQKPSQQKREMAIGVFSGEHAVTVTSPLLQLGEVATVAIYAVSGRMVAKMIYSGRSGSVTVPLVNCAKGYYYGSVSVTGKARALVRFALLR